MRRRKVTYPPAKTATSGGSGPPTGADLRAAAAASRTVSINLDAIKGRAQVREGTRVQITSGIYAGEFAIVESLVGGVIPAAVVRTEAGRTRRARTIDLVPSPVASEPKNAEPVAAAAEPPEEAPAAPPADAPAKADAPAPTKATEAPAATPAD